MSAGLDKLMKERATFVVDYIQSYFAEDAIATRLAERLGGGAHGATAKALPPGLGELMASIRYSALQEGGKRFRPVLTMLAAEALGEKPELVLPFAAALECVHTYSLIHDDLPAMDNDDFRRGQPTNHKKFNEATAILAGDALLTEAFVMVSQAYRETPAQGLRAVAELATAAGLVGMVGGQAVDMAAKKEAIAINELRTMHRLKTGALIRVAAVAAATLCGASSSQRSDLEAYADSLGLAFQVADDILDFDPERPEPGSYPALLGIEKTRLHLDELTDSCLASLASWPATAEPLRAIAQYNRSRSY
jgi:geranylgeranyl diphosphate synthase type II